MENNQVGAANMRALSLSCYLPAVNQLFVCVCDLFLLQDSIKSQLSLY